MCEHCLIITPLTLKINNKESENVLNGFPNF